MKRIKKFLTFYLFIILIVFSCTIPTASKNDNNDSTDKKNEDNSSSSSVQVEKNVTEEAKKYRYLDYMYSGTNGKSLNNMYMNGSIFDLYPDEIRKAVNDLLKFPIQDISSANNSANWWESLPDNIKDYITGLGSDILSEGLLKFFSSEEGKQFIEEQLNEIEIKLKELIDYGIDELEDRYETEITLLLGSVGFMAISNGVIAYAALNGKVNMTMNPYSPIVSGVSFIFSYLQNQEISNQLANIQKYLVQINAKLESIETKINSLIGYTADIAVYQRYEKVKEAREMIITMERQINTILEINPEGIKKQIKENLENIYDGYENKFDKAFYAANETQNWLNNNKFVKKMEIPVVIKRFHVTNKFKTYAEDGHRVDTYSVKEISSIKFNLFEPPYYIKDTEKNISMSFDDIGFMINMSKFRFQLANYVYQGDDIIKYRMYNALIDSNEKFSLLNDALDNTVKEVSEYIKTYSLKLNEPSYKTLNPDMKIRRYDVFVLIYNNKTYNISSRLLNYRKYRKDRYLPYKVKTIYDLLIGKKCIPPAAKMYSGFMHSDNRYLKENLYELLKDEYLKINSQYLINLKSMITAWLITLQAHIDAGSNL